MVFFSVKIILNGFKNYKLKGYNWFFLRLIDCVILLLVGYNNWFSLIIYKCIYDVRNLGIW